MQLEAKTFKLRFLICFLISFLFELPFVWNFFFFFHAWPDSLALKLVFIHLIASLVWLFYEPWKGLHFFAIDRYWSRLFFFFNFCFPVFGLVIILGIFWAIQDKPIISQDDFEFDEFYRDTKIHPVTQMKSDRERVLTELDFMPLADIMEGDDAQLKRGAIERLGELKTPEAIHLLMKYRSDPLSEIRFFVTGTLVKIKTDLEELLDSAKKQMQVDIYKVSARVFLARIYWNYVQSGLLDDVTAAGYTREAIYHLVFSIESDYATTDAYKLLGEIYFARSLTDEFRLLMAHMEKKKGNIDESLLHGWVRLCFQNKNFMAVKACLKELCETRQLNAEWAPLVAWWGD